MSIKINKSAIVVDYNSSDSRSGTRSVANNAGDTNVWDDPNAILPGNLIDNSAKTNSWSDSTMDAIFRAQSTETYEINIPVGTGLAYPLSLKGQAQFPEDNKSTLKHDGFPPMMLFNVVDPIAARVRSKYSIALKVPNSVKINHNAKWDELDLGLLVGAGTSYATGGSIDTVDALRAISGRAASNFADTTTGLNIGAGFAKANRQMINNHAAVSFQGMGFRILDLTFEMQPKSAAEAREVKAIIKAFKYCAHPEGSAGGGTADNSQFYLWPNNFFINLYGPGLVHVLRTSPCALISADIEYVGAGTPAWLVDGRPASVILHLVFKELELLTKTRIKQGW